MSINNLKGKRISTKGNQKYLDDANAAIGLINDKLRENPEFLEPLENHPVHFDVVKKFGGFGGITKMGGSTIARRMRVSRNAVLTMVVQAASWLGAYPELEPFITKFGPSPIELSHRDRIIHYGIKAALDRSPDLRELLTESDHGLIVDLRFGVNGKVRTKPELQRQFRLKPSAMSMLVKRRLERFDIIT
ncbi:MAG: hypothetical protein V1835_04125 [Candidatus Micrarchaeota archaeon]